MEIGGRNQEVSKNPSPTNSPNGVYGHGNSIQMHNTPPISPIPISRSDSSNPYPTTFVQADTSTFKQVVQLLTGSSETAKQASNPRNNQDPPPQPPTPRIFNIPPKRQQNSFKLYERRNNANLKNSSTSLMINTFLPPGFAINNNNHISGFSPRNNNKTPEILSPSLLEFPKLTLSPVTPLSNEDPFNRNSPNNFGSYSSSSSSEEERAIAEKGFYLHPSPISTPRDSEPQLLPLFPVTSPKASGS